MAWNQHKVSGNTVCHAPNFIGSWVTLYWVNTGPVIVSATLWNNCNKVPGESNLGNRGFSSDHSLRRLPILAGKAWRRECDGWPYCVCCGDPERERERRVSASPLYPSYSDMLPSTPGGGQISYLKYANRCSLTDKPRGWQPRMTLSPIKLTICVNCHPTHTIHRTFLLG